MYQKPVVRRFGTLREVTLVGGNTRPTDGFSVYGSTAQQIVPVVTPPALARS